MYLGRVVLIASFAVLFAGSSSAITVTLSGSCSGVYAENSTQYVKFSISNSGDSPATNLSIVPYSYKLLFSPVEKFLPILYNGNGTALSFAVSNATLNGTYAFGILVSYGQAGQIFTVAFPCIATVGKASPALMFISNISFSNNRLATQITNTYARDVSADMYFISPPSFSISPMRTAVYARADSIASEISNASFTASFNGKVTVTAAISYIINNTAYASIVILPISPSLPARQAGIDPLWLIIAAVIAVLLALIIASVVIRLRRRA